MTAYEVTFEFTMEQWVTVEANSKAEAIAKVRNGDFSSSESDCQRTSAPRRKYRADSIRE